jgi:Cu(I)/Ag(I) efflux system membrane fusion protein
VDLHAELPGYVLQKSAVHGMRVMPADILFDIADLSAVWILADVYESDLATVELGMSAEVTLAYQPGRTWRGEVAFVNPIVEPGTRTVKVRIEVANDDYALKPDMFADVVLRRELGDALFVPASAVLKAGERQIVFLDRGDGRLEPREIETGARVEGGYAVLSGIAEGDKVVTSANFLIDSESSLKAALSSMGTVPPAGDPHKLAPDPGGSPANAKPPRARPDAAAYACPMHPEVTSAGPGSCRICGMPLAPSSRP